MSIGIVKRYQTNVEEVDAIFETSLVLKKTYESGIESILKLDSLNYTQKNSANNLLKLIKNIEEKSINSAESGAWARLYPQAIITVVSISEQILKDVFETLIYSNLENLEVLDKKDFKFEDVRKKGFSLDKQDWFELVLKEIYNEANPTDKINLQNIKAIQGLFKDYFELSIPIPEKVSNEMHYFYQLRHILIHNSGEIDERFIRNLAKVNYLKKFKKGERIKAKAEDYERCKDVFLDFFRILENKIDEF